MSKRAIAFLLMLILFIHSSSLSETLKYGMASESVRILQEALIEQGYLTGNADGVFGYQTEKAVCAFQQAKKLKVDGLAGQRTQDALHIKTNSMGNQHFSGDYSTINESSNLNRIQLLQKALIQMKYLRGNPDGSYGAMTKAAVSSFQKNNNLKRDGIAGKKTLKAIENALAKGHKVINTIEDAPPVADTAGKIDAPKTNEIQLLHWFNDVKPSLKCNAKLIVYELVSGLAWTLMVHSKGRHCDAEPLTLMDTQIMLKAFKGKNTWNQKGVYILLPDGRWTIGATHTVPHLNGYIKDNGFDGHLCVHFYRDMEECKRNDPNYGVSNQNTIRALWKKVKGKAVQ